MMENEMIKWFIDNLKPPYYEKMISTQVTHFASLIPIREHIDEGIRSKKIMDPKSLISIIKQQVKKMSGRKVKEANVHMVDNASKGVEVLLLLMQPQLLDLIINRFSLLKHLTVPLIREGGQTPLIPL